MIPGHEIVGLVAAVGAEVTKFKIGDKVRITRQMHACFFLLLFEFKSAATIVDEFRFTRVHIHQVGVGVFVDSCRSCGNCKGGEEQYCTGDGTLGSAVFTYNFRLPNGELVHGGYSQAIVVDEGACVRACVEAQCPHAHIQWAARIHT